MLFETFGDKNNPAVLFFHAMGVTGASSEPVVRYLKEKYFCIMPTSTVYCEGQTYLGKADEVRQTKEYLINLGVKSLAMVVASSIGADLAMSFLINAKMPVGHVFFDGGQFAQISKSMRELLTPLLYLAIKSLYLTNGGTLKKIMWCDDDSIKPYFINAGKALKYKNISRQMEDSLEDKPFPALSDEMQQHTYFSFGSDEEHFKYRDALMKAYPKGNFPVFEGYNHMQYQIRDPKSFADMLVTVIEKDSMPDLICLKK